MTLNLLLGQRLGIDVPRNFSEVFPKRTRAFKAQQLSELLGQYLCINSEEKTRCWGLQKRHLSLKQLIIFLLKRFPIQAAVHTAEWLTVKTTPSTPPKVLRDTVQ